MGSLKFIDLVRLNLLEASLAWSLVVEQVVAGSLMFNLLVPDDVRFKAAFCSSVVAEALLKDGEEIS